MLALMVLCLVVVDLIMLVVYSAVEGAKGSLGTSLIRDKEFREKVEGVSIDKHYLMEALYFSRERKSQELKDWMLALVVLYLVVVDLIML